MTHEALHCLGAESWNVSICCQQVLLQVFYCQLRVFHLREPGGSSWQLPASATSNLPFNLWTKLPDVSPHSLPLSFFSFPSLLWWSLNFRGNFSYFTLFLTCNETSQSAVKVKILCKIHILHDFVLQIGQSKLKFCL